MDPELMDINEDPDGDPDVVEDGEVEDADETDLYADITAMTSDGVDAGNNGGGGGGGITDMDLYDDILAEEQHQQNVSYDQLCTKFADAVNTIKKLEEEKSALSNTQVTVQLLENNMSSLIKTARAELLRKEGEITRLRNKLSDTRLPRNMQDSPQSSVRGGRGRQLPRRQRNYNNRESSTQDDTDRNSSFSSREAETDLRQRVAGSSSRISSSTSEKDTDTMECNTTAENSYSIDSDFKPMLFSSPAVETTSEDSRRKSTNVTSNVHDSNRNAERFIEKFKYANKESRENCAVSDKASCHTDNSRYKSKVIPNLNQGNPAKSNHSCKIPDNVDRQSDKYNGKYRHRIIEDSSDKRHTAEKTYKYSKAPEHEHDDLSPSFRTVKVVPKKKSASDKHIREKYVDDNQSSSQNNTRGHTSDRKPIVFDINDSEKKPTSNRNNTVEGADEKPMDLREKLRQKRLKSQSDKNILGTHAFSSSHESEPVSECRKLKRNVVDSVFEDKHINPISTSHSSANKSRPIVQYNDSDNLFDVCAEEVEQASSGFCESLKSSKCHASDSIIKTTVSHQSKATVSTANHLGKDNKAVEKITSENMVINKSKKQSTSDELKPELFKEDFPKLININKEIVNHVEDTNNSISKEKNSSDNENLLMMHSQTDIEDAVINDDIGIKLADARKWKSCRSDDTISIHTSDFNQKCCSETVSATEKDTHNSKRQNIALEKIQYRQDVEEIHVLPTGNNSALSPNSVPVASPDFVAKFSSCTNSSDTSLVTDWTDPNSSLSGQSSPISSTKSSTDQLIGSISAQISSSHANTEILSPTPSSIDATSSLLDVKSSHSDILVAVNLSISDLEPITNSSSTISSCKEATSPLSTDESTTNCTVHRGVTSETISSVSYGDDSSEDDNCAEDVRKSSTEERKPKKCSDTSKKSLQTSLESRGSFGSNILSEQTSSLNTSMLTDSSCYFSDDDDDDDSICDSSDGNSYSTDDHNSDNTTSNSDLYFSSCTDDSESSLDVDSSSDASMEENVKHPMVNVAQVDVNIANINDAGEVTDASADKRASIQTEKTATQDSMAEAVEIELKDNTLCMKHIDNAHTNTKPFDKVIVKETHDMDIRIISENNTLSVMKIQPRVDDAKFTDTDSQVMTMESDNAFVDETISSNLHQNNEQVSESKGADTVKLETNSATMNNMDKALEPEYNMAHSSPTSNKTESVSDDSGIGSVQTNRSNILQRLLGVISTAIETEPTKNSMSRRNPEKLGSKSKNITAIVKKCSNSSSNHDTATNESVHKDIVERKPTDMGEVMTNVSTVEAKENVKCTAENEDLTPMTASSTSDMLNNGSAEHLRNISGHSQYIVEDEEPMFLTAPTVSDTDIFETDGYETECMDSINNSNKKSTPNKRTSPIKINPSSEVKLLKNSPDNMTSVSQNFTESTVNFEKVINTEMHSPAKVFILYSAAVSPAASLTNVVDVSSPSKARINNYSPKGNAIILSPAKLLVIPNPKVPPVTSHINEQSYKRPSKHGFPFQSEARKNSNKTGNIANSDPVKKPAIHTNTATMKATSSIKSDVKELNATSVIQSDCVPDLKYENANIENVAKILNFQNPVETMEASASLTSVILDTDEGKTEENTYIDNDAKLSFLENGVDPIDSNESETEKNKSDKNVTEVRADKINAEISEDVTPEHQLPVADENLKTTYNSYHTGSKGSKKLCENERCFKGKYNENSMAFADVIINSKAMDSDKNKVATDASEQRSHRKTNDNINRHIDNGKNSETCIVQTQDVEMSETTSELEETNDKCGERNRVSNIKYSKCAADNSECNKPLAVSVKTSMIENNRAITEITSLSSPRKESSIPHHDIDTQSGSSSKSFKGKHLTKSVFSETVQREHLDDKDGKKRRSPRKKLNSSSTDKNVYFSTKNKLNAEAVLQTNKTTVTDVGKNCTEVLFLKEVICSNAKATDKANKAEKRPEVKKTTTSDSKNKDDKKYSAVNINQTTQTKQSSKTGNETKKIKQVSTISDEMVKSTRKEVSKVDQLDTRETSKLDRSNMVNDTPKANKLKTAAQQDKLYKQILNKSPAKSTRSATKLTIERLNKGNEGAKCKTRAAGMNPDAHGSHNVKDTKSNGKSSKTDKSKTKNVSRNVLSMSHPISIDKEPSKNERIHRVTKTNDKKEKCSPSVRSKRLPSFENQMEKYEDYMLNSRKNTKIQQDKLAKTTACNVRNKSQVVEKHKHVANPKSMESCDVRKSSIDRHIKTSVHTNDAECLLPFTDKSNLSDEITECYYDSSYDEEKVLRDIYEKDFCTPMYDTDDPNGAHHMVNAKYENKLIGLLSQQSSVNVEHDDTRVVDKATKEDNVGSSEAVQHLINREKTLKRRSCDKFGSPRKPITVSVKNQIDHNERSTKHCLNKSKDTFIFHAEDTLDGIDYMDNMATDDSLLKNENDDGSENSPGVHNFSKYSETILKNVDTNNASIEDGELTDSDEELELPVCYSETKNLRSNAMIGDKMHVLPGNLPKGDIIKPDSRLSPVRFPERRRPRDSRRSRSSSIGRRKRGIRRSPVARHKSRSLSRSPKHHKSNENTPSIKTRRRLRSKSPACATSQRSRSKSPKHGQSNKKKSNNTKSRSKSPVIVWKHRSRSTSRSPEHSNYETKRSLKVLTMSRSKSRSQSPLHGKRCSKVLSTKHRTRSRSRSPNNGRSTRQRTPDRRFTRKRNEKRKSRERADSASSVAESPLLDRHRCVARSTSPRSRGKGRRSKSQSPVRHRGHDSAGHASMRNRRSRSTSPSKCRTRRTSKSPPSRGRHRSKSPRGKVRRRSISPRSRALENSPYFRGKYSRLSDKRCNCREKHQLRDKNLNMSLNKDVLKTPILHYHTDTSSDENEGRYSKHASEKRPDVNKHRHVCENNTPHGYKRRKRHYSTSEDERLRSSSPECSSHSAKRRRSRSPCVHDKHSLKSGSSSVKDDIHSVEHEKHSNCSRRHKRSGCCTARDVPSTKCRHRSGNSCSENENITPPSRRSRRTKTHLSDSYR